MSQPLAPSPANTQEFDRIDEGEVSALSQQVAKREEAMMWREFREKMLYNLGLVGAAFDTVLVPLHYKREINCQCSCSSVYRSLMDVPLVV